MKKLLLAVLLACACGQGVEPDEEPAPAPKAPLAFRCMPQRLFCLDGKVWRCNSNGNDAWLWDACAGNTICPSGNEDGEAFCR